MRISDWSSDVCSSDLKDVADLQRPATHEDRRDRAAALVELRLDHRAFGGAVGVGLQLHDLGLHRDRIEQFVEAGLLERRHFDILNVAAHFLNPQPLFEQARTEEHTSELTSLIRTY